MSVELNDILTKLFKEWGSKETDDVPYLYLLIMWIETRDFRREKEEEVMPDRDRQRRGSIPFAQRKNSNAGVSLLPNQLHGEVIMWNIDIYHKRKLIDTTGPVSQTVSAQVLFIFNS